MLSLQKNWEYFGTKSFQDITFVDYQFKIDIKQNLINL